MTVRITAKQKAARRKNIAIARSYKKKRSGKLLPHSKKVAARNSKQGGAGIKGKRITAKQKVARKKNIAIARKHKKKAINSAVSEILQQKGVIRGNRARKLGLAKKAARKKFINNAVNDILRQKGILRN